MTDRPVFGLVLADQKDDAERRRYPQVIDRYEDPGPVAGVREAAP